ADWILAGPEPARDRLAHDGDVGPRHAVIVRERATFENADTVRLEVVGSADLEGKRGVLLSLLIRLPLEVDALLHDVETDQRRRVNRSRRGRAGNRLDARDEAIRQLDHLSIGIVFARVPRVRENRQMVADVARVLVL